MGARRTDWKAWSVNDKKMLIQCVENGETWDECARKLNRTKQAVARKAKNLGFSIQHRKSAIKQDLQKCLNCKKTECDNCLNGW